ncbi:hypothetical protein PG991_007700 [Apiospora marii]|uniref:Ankyrin repeat domain-containing protein n=1 Tax=Apiospora marii TaxID=335849 RepID=A0ABR1RU67_9PEZI
MFDRALGNGQHELAKALISDGTDLSAKEPSIDAVLHAAARNGRLDLFNLLLANGVDLNSQRSRGALWEAARFGRLEMVKRLLHLGVEVKGNTPCGRVNEGSAGHAIFPPIPHEVVELERTPLYAAIIANNLRIAEVLLNAGAGVDLKDDDYKTLILEAGKRGKKIVYRLKKARVVAKAHRDQQSFTG